MSPLLTLTLKSDCSVSKVHLNLILQGYAYKRISSSNNGYHLLLQKKITVIQIRVLTMDSAWLWPMTQAFNVNVRLGLWDSGVQVSLDWVASCSNDKVNPAFLRCNNAN